MTLLRDTAAAPRRIPLSSPDLDPLSLSLCVLSSSLCLPLSKNTKQAGVSALWYKYVGLDGQVVGVDKYGMSAPGDIVMKEYGMTAENLIEVCKSYM